MYQEFDAQRIPYTYVAPRSLPFRTKPELNSESSTLLPHQQQDMPVDFAPSDISRSSSVKVISGHFGKIAGPPLSLHSDVTGAAFQRTLCKSCSDLSLFMPSSCLTPRCEHPFLNSPFYTHQCWIFGWLQQTKFVSQSQQVPSFFCSLHANIRI